MLEELLPPQNVIDEYIEYVLDLYNDEPDNTAWRIFPHKFKEVAQDEPMVLLSGNLNDVARYVSHQPSFWYKSAKQISDASRGAVRVPTYENYKWERGSINTFKIDKLTTEFVDNHVKLTQQMSTLQLELNNIKHKLNGETLK